MHRLRDAGFPFHVITVLTSASMDKADAFFDFYRSEGIAHVCFTVVEQEGAHTQTSLDRGGVPAYRRFLERYLARMADAADAPRCREVDGMLGLALGAVESRRGND